MSDVRQDQVSGGPDVVDEPDVPFGSNSVRLTGLQWTAACGILVVICLGAPHIWQRIEPFAPGPDYRIPYALSDDYWHYRRYANCVAAEHAPVLVLGDSVVWGQYVAPNETLSHYLNEGTSGERFHNLGVNGIHPVALAGLIDYYGRDITGRKVILHYNPLWMSSKRRDLQTDRPARFNHPDLVPQFYPNIPCYDASYAERLGIVVARNSSFLSWADHLRSAYFGNLDIPAWTLDHPYSNPISAITLRLPDGADRTGDEPAPWFEKNMAMESFSWVSLNESMQWSFFLRSLRLLEERGNDVFVVVGPFNEHMLTPASQAVYAQLRDAIQARLERDGIACLVPAVLPSKYYADASHLLSRGYEMLAEQILADGHFIAFLERTRS